MERKITFAQYGCGKMGKYLIRYGIEKGAELVAAFDVNPAILGKDAAEIAGDGYPATGIQIADASQADEILGNLKPDVCIIATRSTIAELEDIFTICAKHVSMRLQPVKKHYIHGTLLLLLHTNWTNLLKRATVH